MIFFGVSDGAMAFVAVMSEWDSLNCGASRRFTFWTCQESSSTEEPAMAGVVSMLIPSTCRTRQLDRKSEVGSQPSSGQ